MADPSSPEDDLQMPPIWSSAPIRCDRISPKARLPSFVGTAAGERDYTVRIDEDFFMPGCCSNDKDQGPQKKPDDSWREPPGYLGEAVRRAKLIPSRRDKAAGAGAEA
jgi:hypothetical protein